MILKSLVGVLIFKHHASRNVHTIAKVSELRSENVVGKRVKVQGWIRALRKMKDNVFLDVCDGSSAERLQVVVAKSDKLQKLTYGSSVQLEGDLGLAPNNRLELKATNIKVIGTCDVLNDAYPFAPRKKYDADYVRDFLHLRPRTKGFGSLLRLRDAAEAAIADHLRNSDYIKIHTPILTSNDCEGAGEVFLVKPESTKVINSMIKEGQSAEEVYFNTKAFLTVSGQLQLEAAARAITKVYTFGPTFRAENSKSRLHLSEFYMLETEVAFADSIHEIAEEAETLIKSVTKSMMEKNAADFHAMGAKEPNWLDKPFPYITYEDAINILEQNSDRLNVPIDRSEGITKDHELFLVQHNAGVPMFILEWPKDMKPFYMRETKHDPTKVDAMDLLVPNVGELIGGSMRVDDYEKLKQVLPSERLQWYLDLRKFGNVPTGGFGMGFERFLQCVLNIANIKDAMPFPRWPHHCDL